MRTKFLISSLLISATLSAMPAWADKGRFIATGGATSIEGSAGGGIVPWATLSSYAEEGQWGATAAVTEVSVDDFKLSVLGVSLSYGNRFELSAAKQTFDLSTIGGELKQDVFGLKYRVAGDLIYGNLPQFSIGLQHKRNRTFDLPAAVGAQRDSGTDYYVSAAKVWLDGPFHRTWLANITLRATKANQTGLLGFGGDQNNDYEIQPELALGMFINRHWTVGAEYRTKPDNLGFAEEHDWYDVFVAYFPTKSISVVAAYADLDSIAGLANQTGWYLSVQATF